MQDVIEHGFPAHAGMDLARRSIPTRFARFPRTRGDGPTANDNGGIGNPVSPHTRGWTPGSRRRTAVRGGFPAHAGMDPALEAADASSVRFPRTRGDGPVAPLICMPTR